MRSDLIRVTQPVWVRIVNPDPIIILDQAYRYGDVLRTCAGATIRILWDDGPRALACYRAPYAPSDRYECPSDALLFHTVDDLRMLAEGKLTHDMPLDPDLPTGIQSAPMPPCRILPSQTARVPADRRVRAMQADIMDVRIGGPYREESVCVVQVRHSSKCMLRPGGTLTALEHRGAHVKVRYARAPDYDGEQCEDGRWFWMPAIEFITMETRYQTLRTLEHLEQDEIRRIVRSIEWRP